MGFGVLTGHRKTSVCLILQGTDRVSLTINHFLFLIISSFLQDDMMPVTPSIRSCNVQHSDVFAVKNSVFPHDVKA